MLQLLELWAEVDALNRELKYQEAERLARLGWRESTTLHPLRLVRWLQRRWARPAAMPEVLPSSVSVRLALPCRRGHHWPRGAGVRGSSTLQRRYTPVRRIAEVMESESQRS